MTASEIKLLKFMESIGRWVNQRKKNHSDYSDPEIEDEDLIVIEKAEFNFKWELLI